MGFLQGRRFRLASLASLICAVAAPGHAASDAHAFEDSLATFMSWVVLIIVPVIGISLFLLVHVLPERIAKKRHHPQKDAIHMLCLLSLVFGGLLWPLAWLWAYTRPTAYKRAYGTDKHDDYFAEMAMRAESGELTAEDAAHLETQFAAIDAVGHLHPVLQSARQAIGRVANPSARQVPSDGVA